MKPISTTQLHTTDLVASQWVWIEELVNDIKDKGFDNSQEAKQALLVNGICAIYPILVERHGCHSILKSESDVNASHIDELIQFKLGEPKDKFSAGTETTAHYTNIAFSLPSLQSWLAIKQFDFNLRPWDEWMRDCHPILKSRELLAECGRPEQTINNTSEQRSASLTMSYGDLQKLSGYKTPAEITAWLSSKGIPFITSARNRPITTLTAINSVLGVLETGLPEKRTITL